MHGQQNDKYAEMQGQQNHKYIEMHGQQNDKYTEMHGQQNDKYTEMHGQQNDKYTEMHGQQNHKYTEMHGQQNDKYTEMHGQQNVKRCYVNITYNKTVRILIKLDFRILDRGIFSVLASESGFYGVQTGSGFCPQHFSIHSQYHSANAPTQSLIFYWRCVSLTVDSVVKQYISLSLSLEPHAADIGHEQRAEWRKWEWFALYVNRQLAAPPIGMSVRTDGCAL